MSWHNILAPRILTSHLPLDLIPYSPQAKYICIFRNPKDVLVSQFYQNLGFKLSTPDAVDDSEQFKEFLSRFLDGKLVHGNYYDHLKNFLPCIDRPNIKLVLYEDLVENG